MQTTNAPAHRQRIEAAQLGRVLWTNGESKTSFAAQYHPKTVPGNIMPELDTMYPTEAWPDMLGSRWAPWHGFPGTYEKYAPAMKRTAHIHVVDVKFRLPMGDDGVLNAAWQWKNVFGVPLIGKTLTFTNATMEFLPGEEGKREGLESLTVAVQGKGKLVGILQRARREGILRDGFIDLCGAKWYFVYAGEENESKI
jgi:hypothetical protein